MNKTNLKLMAISELHSLQKENHAVSILKNMSDDQIVISRYGDHVWDFYPYFPQDNLLSYDKIINWKVELPDGQSLLDTKHIRLRESAKDFIWSLFAAPIEGKKRPTMGTLVARFDVLIPLLRWMVSQNLDQFKQLEGRTLEYVRFAGLNQKTGAKVSASTLHYRLRIVECLYLQRTKIKDALQSHPWPFETAMTLSGIKRSASHRRPTTSMIPDKVAIQLARVAIEYVDQRFPEIMKAKNTCEEVGASVITRHRQKRTDAKTSTAKSLGYTGMHEVSRLSLHVRTACYIIIDMFSGIRNSEMTSLETNCISRSKSRDGSTDVIWLHGTIYKTGLRAKKWIVPDVVARAVNVLEELTAHLREELRTQIPILETALSKSQNSIERTKITKRLYKARKQCDKLFLINSSKQTKEISVISGKATNSDLKLFCKEHDIYESLGIPYRLHSHQFRRTYAMFVARAELGDLLSLREHFGHVSMDMTTHYLEGATDQFEVDTELLNMVSEEKNARQKDIVKELLISEEPLANGTHWLKNWRSAVRTATNKEALIAEYAGTLTLNGTGHSWCVGNAKGNGCGGLCVFEAQLCVDCHYGIIGQEHRPIWEGIRDQQTEVLQIDDIGPGGRARATQILAQAEKVLKRLDGKLKS